MASSVIKKQHRLEHVDLHANTKLIAHAGAQYTLFTIFGVRNVPYMYEVFYTVSGNIHVTKITDSSNAVSNIEATSDGFKVTFADTYNQCDIYAYGNGNFYERS